MLRVLGIVLLAATAAGARTRPVACAPARCLTPDGQSVVARVKRPATESIVVGLTDVAIAPGRVAVAQKPRAESVTVPFDGATLPAYLMVGAYPAARASLAHP